MDILVTKVVTKSGIDYYNFWSAEKKDGKVYLYELAKNRQEFAFGGTKVTPTEKIIDHTKGNILMKREGKFYIPCGEVIGRYNPDKEYWNTFKA